MSKSFISIGEHEIGSEQPPFLIAEAGINHNGKTDIAKKLIDKASEAGADAVKFQSWSTGRFVAKGDFSAQHIEDDGVSSEGTMYSLIETTELSQKQHEELKKYAEEREIMFLSTPYDRGSADLLDELGVEAFKIGSGDLNNLPLLSYVAEKGKPMIVSTGMGTLGEVEEALKTIKETGNEKVILLQCTSVYPPKLENVNLRVMDTYRKAFDVEVGYSDHTKGIAVPLAAVSRGASVIEKHFTLDRSMAGPDQKGSAEPDEFEQLVNRARDARLALGSPVKAPSPQEEETKESFRRSLVAAKEIEKGQTIVREDIALKRPGTGLSPKMLEFVIGREAKNSLERDELISEFDI